MQEIKKVVTLPSVLLIMLAVELQAPQIQTFIFWDTLCNLQ